MIDRTSALTSVVGAYEDELSVAESRREHTINNRDQLVLVREFLIEHGQESEADQLKVEIQDLDHQVQATESLIAKLKGLIGKYQSGLT